MSTLRRSYAMSKWGLGQNTHAGIGCLLIDDEKFVSTKKLDCCHPKLIIYRIG